jgi:ATP-dependent RNA helicase DDX21
MGTPLDEFDLSFPVKDALRDAGFVNLFPVQAATLPSVAAGRDVVVRARPGTGKTLGFLIPMIDFLVKHGAAKRPSRDRKPLALIMTPTRELAIQVEGEFEKVASALALRSVCVYGGTPYVKQASALRSGVDVVVGTPGRITDMINQGYLNLSDIKFAVLDEADDMLRVGYVSCVFLQS